METINQIISTTLAQLPATQTSQPQQPKKPTEAKRQKWIDTYLHLKITHPQLLEACNAAHAFACDVFSKPSAGRGLVLWGKYGTGKTHIAKGLCRWFEDVRLSLPLVRGRNENGELDMQVPERRFVNWPQVVDGIKQEQWEIFDWLNAAYLTVVDDIGAEHDPSGFGREKLYLLLNAREFKYTVVTTNIHPNDWTKKLTERIASRLLRNFTLIDMSQVPDFNT